MRCAALRRTTAVLIVALVTGALAGVATAQETPRYGLNNQLDTVWLAPE